MQRMRDRKKGMRQLADMARRGMISEAVRAEREAALRTSRVPRVVMAAWADAGSIVTRNAVTVTPRAEQSIKQEAEENAEGTAPSAAASAPSARAAFADKAKALQWLRGEGEAILMRRCQVMKSKAGRMIQRWSVTLAHDLTAIAEIILETSATSAQGSAFENLIVNQVARRAAEMLGPALPFPLADVKRS
jgi:hypothetical protein